MNWITIPVGKKSRKPMCHDWPEIQTQEHSVRAWAEADERWPGPKGAAVLTGPSGLLVVDLDINHADGANGVDSVMDLIGQEETRSWLLSVGVVCQTPRGGLHAYHLRPEGIRGTHTAIKPGIDLRGAGGLVIAPPTPGYRWLRSTPDNLTVAPPWLLGLVEKKEERHLGPSTGDKYRVDCPVCGHERSCVIFTIVGRVQGIGSCSACGRRWRASSKQVAWAAQNQVR